VTLPRPSLLIVLQNPPMLHQFTDKSASWLMVNPPKLNWLIPNTDLFNTEIVQITENIFPNRKTSLPPVLEQF
jgi:hypothetical protein